MDYYKEAWKIDEEINKNIINSRFDVNYEELLENIENNFRVVTKGDEVTEDYSKHCDKYTELITISSKLLYEVDKKTNKFPMADIIFKSIFMDYGETKRTFGDYIFVKICQNIVPIMRSKGEKSMALKYAIFISKFENKEE